MWFDIRVSYNAEYASFPHSVYCYVNLVWIYQTYFINKKYSWNLGFEKKDNLLFSHSRRKGRECMENWAGKHRFKRFVKVLTGNVF